MEPVDNEDDFSYFYQKYKFLENSNHKIEVARAKRIQLILNALQSRKYCDPAATHFLLQHDLEEYSRVVDSKTGVNNYADFINSVCSKSPSLATNIDFYKELTYCVDCNKWTSNLGNFSSLAQIMETANLKSKSTEEKAIEDHFFSNLQEQLRVLKEKADQECKTEDSKLTSISKNIVQIDETNEFSSPSLRTTNLFLTTRPSVPAYESTDTNSQTKNPISSVTLSSSVNSTEKDLSNGFRTARTELKIQNLKKNNSRDNDSLSREPGTRCSLGARRRPVNAKFVPPIKSSDPPENCYDPGRKDEHIEEDERLKNLDPKLIEMIRSEIIDHGKPIAWDDIAGLEFAKKTIQEIVIWPMLRPDIFTGLRRPPKGILLFGPPGTGKTLIGKCIASQSSSTFFSISASSLLSKWIGESEKLVRTLFAVARCHQPAVIFIDEIDSLLKQRSDTEHESSRRVKTEFLVQLDGATTDDNDRILVIGATNRPQELDEAARRRLVKRLYIPLPKFEARRHLVQRLMQTERNELVDESLDEIASLTEGYSGADMKNLCQEASLGPIRCIDFRLMSSIDSQEVRPVTLADFYSAMKVVRSSVSSSDLNQYLEWDRLYGSSGN